MLGELNYGIHIITKPRDLNKICPGVDYIEEVTICT